MDTLDMAELLAHEKQPLPIDTQVFLTRNGRMIEDYEQPIYAPTYPQED